MMTMMMKMKLLELVKLIMLRTKERKFIRLEMNEALKMLVAWKKEDSLDKFRGINTQESDQTLQWIIWLTATKFTEKTSLMMTQMLKMKNTFNFQIKERVE